MRQTVLSVTLEVKPESAVRLSGLIDALHDRAGKGGPTQSDYGWFMQAVPAVHFLSMNLFPSAEYDPVFVLEANFDGAPSPFWQDLETAIGADLRAMLSCCKQPLDETGALFAAVTAPGSNAAIAPYMEARTAQPSVFHMGNRGMTRDRIVAERGLFLAIRDELATAQGGSANPYRGIEADAVHARLRDAMIGRFAWLDEKAPVRVSLGETIVDWLRLIGFVAAALLVLAVPGLCAALFAIAIRAFGTATPLASPSHIALLFVLAGVAGVIVSLGIILFWVRYLERRDSSHDAPPIDPELLRQMVQREDWIPQNHMGSIVLLKPGALRTLIVHAGHHALHLALRAIPTSGRDGYLGSMRTVHFAHWAFVNNGGRLMFFSNFDQSWESYLDDFIEKAHVGLTLAWGCGVGFPPTRYLIADGASYGTRFKNWARHSMTVSRFWYSAYPDLTVDQVERNNRIANALRKPKLTPKEAAAWIDDL
ncbi:hypothetical protein [Sphingomonas nostoxanthinifaciens]|uniref:hypothetical protein n=1 Tax=Sphingomonas nostoxanthinifaciens TaxID=2872652 RepID=UPI001CC1C8DD|nr:hypothetical protein [Sphingomonas nostoxanthinifaciens]UAK25948.1 hypothetical protein K8P63_07460 [Sphingomonas nostoxanthinifaciens]